MILEKEVKNKVKAFYAMVVCFLTYFGSVHFITNQKVLRYSSQAFQNAILSSIWVYDVQDMTP
jgi:hypothetical protein